MRDRLIELLEDNFPERYEVLLRKDIEKLADHLLANGVVLLDLAVVTPENRPLIAQIANMPLNDVCKLIKAKQEGRVIVPPAKVGQTVYFLLECDDEWCLSEDTVTEVCSRGFYVSAFSPPQSDHGHFTEYGELGGTVFTDKAAAELALKEREGT